MRAITDPLPPPPFAVASDHVGPHERATIARAWLRLGVGSLAVAGSFAVLVAVARSPGVQSIVGERYFRVALVGHVTFSLSVWTMACAVLLWGLVAERAGLRSDRRFAYLALTSAIAGAITMTVASVLGLGQPLLIDYVPTLDHPLFITGLVLFFSGVALAALDFLTAAYRVADASLEVQAMRIGAVVYLAGFTTALVALTSGWQHDLMMVMWGPGHLMQVVNAASLVVAWSLLLDRPLPPRAASVLRATLPLLLIPAVVVPLLYVLPGSPQRLGTQLASWGAVLVTSVTAWAVAVYTHWVARGRSLSAGPLRISLLLFGAGIVLALSGLHGDTRVTAHYHSTVGAITVAFMALVFRLLPRAGYERSDSLVWRVQPTAYGAGLFLLVAGLMWASSFGGTRKVFEVFAQHSPFFGPTLLFTGGAIVTILAGIAFVAAAGLPLLRSPGNAAATADDLVAAGSDERT